MLLDNLEGKMKRFWGDNNLHVIYSSYTLILDNRGEETVSGVIGGIYGNYDGVVAPRETNARNSEIPFISIEETASLNRLEL